MEEVTIEESCRCARFVLNIPPEKKFEFEKKFESQFPDGKLDADDIAYICIKDEEDFKVFIKNFNELQQKVE